MKRIFALILALVFVGMLASCGDDTNVPAPSTVSSNSTENPSDSENPNVPNTPPDDSTPIGPDDSNDKPTVPDVNKPTVESVLSEVMEVFNAPDTFGNEGTISSYTSYTDVNMASYTGGKQCKIESSGIYRIYGTSANGQLYIQAKDQNVILLLDGLNLKYTGSSPAIYAEDCKSLTIILAKNSYNRVEDASINGENGAIKVKSCNLTMGGQGKLVIKANAKHGISNTKELTIKGGTYEISSVRHGIYGKQKVTVNGGKFTINSARSGIKSGDDTVGEETLGQIVINSCSVNIKCNTNGINSYGSVEINNGRISIEALGKGIVATQDININGGTLIMSTTEDTVKSDTNVNITGTSNLKIVTNGNGIECVNATVSTSGVVYIKTMPVFYEDDNGEYKLVDGEYLLLDGSEVANIKKYAVVECKGFEIDNKIVISNGSIGINSYEDGINATVVELSGGNVVIASEKDAVDASNVDDTSGTITLSATVNVNIVDSNKGLKAAVSVTLNGGTSSVIADTDAIKSNAVTVGAGKHILYEKVDCPKESFIIRGGQFISIGTTENPTEYRAVVANALGTIANKSLCVAGQYFTVRMGAISETLTLPKDYSEKMCVIVADATGGECTVIIGDYVQSEVLPQGEVVQ